ncbi:MAG: hypothetical protein ACTTHG_07665 [Treponemataceae bacterium]
MEKQKKIKQEKCVSAKKLPAIFKKTYSTKNFEKKIVKSIYIPDDLKIISDIFQDAKDKKGRPVKKVDTSRTFTRTELKKIKILAKQIKAQKPAIKTVPLAAVAIFLIFFTLVIVTFKDVVFSFALKSAMQGIFEAKTDIEKVDVKIIKSCVQIVGLQQADKNDFMKNLFEIDSINFDYELSDLLKGKFHTRNMSVEGVAINTQRQKSGELKIKPKTTKKQKHSQSKIEKSKENFLGSAVEKLKNMFSGYEPEKMFFSIERELSSPAVALKVSEGLQSKVETWNSVAQNYEQSVKNLTVSVNTIMNTNWSKISDPVVLKNAIEVINTAVIESDNLKEQIQKTTVDLKTDIAVADDYSKELFRAIKVDKQLIDSKIKETKKLFSSELFKSMINDTIEGLLYEKCGKYYPYAVKLKNVALNSAENFSTQSSLNGKKNSEAGKKAKNRKKSNSDIKNSTSKRVAGRTVYYRANTVPSLYIEKILASGYEKETKNLLFNAQALNISNNQNVTGKPSVVETKFREGDTLHSATLTFDNRPVAKNVISAFYAGENLPISADLQVFSFDSKTDVKTSLFYSKTGDFFVKGSMEITPFNFKGMKFEPAKVSSLYNTALKEVKKFTIIFTVTFTEAGDMEISIDNIEKLSSQFINPLSKTLKGEINSIAQETAKKVNLKLSENTGAATDLIAQFSQITSFINLQNAEVANLDKQLESKKQEINRQLTSFATSAVQDALKSRGSSQEIQDAATGIFNFLNKKN